MMCKTLKKYYVACGSLLATLSEKSPQHAAKEAMLRFAKDTSKLENIVVVSEKGYHYPGTDQEDKEYDLRKVLKAAGFKLE